LETEVSLQDPAYRYLLAVLDFQMFGTEPDFSDEACVPFQIAWGYTAYNSMQSVEKRRSFHETDTKEREELIKEMIREYPEYSIRRIAQVTEIPKSTVFDIVNRLNENGFFDELSAAAYYSPVSSLSPTDFSLCTMSDTGQLGQGEEETLPEGFALLEDDADEALPLLPF